MTEQEKQIDEIAKLICNYPYCVNYNTIGGCINAKCTLVDLAENVIRQSYRKERQGEWISVEIELPSKDGKYLVCSNNNRWNKNNVYQARYYTEHGWGQKDKGRSITHWMPLPEAPKTKGE